MKADLIDKKSGSRRQVEDGRQISPDRPSVIVLKLAPEKVARYERRGADLVLVLKDGQEITITGFFITYPAGDGDGQESAEGSEGDTQEAGRNELVLEDDNGVVWWGQYPEQWSEFHFTEVELHDVGGFSWWPLLLGVLGGTGAIAAASGGGGGGGDKGHPPAAVDDAAGGKEDGNPITGNVLTNDSDADHDPLTVASFSVNGTSYKAGYEVSIAGVGTFTLRSDGTYSFTPVANWNGTVPAVTYTVSDGEGGTDTADLVITVDPVNDAPTPVGVIGDQSNADAQAIAGLDVTSYFADIDSSTLTYSASGLPQGLSIDLATGVISGTIDRSASQDGAGGVHSVTITATDGDGASVTQTFTWTVTNPAPAANDDAATTDEDVPVSGNVLAGGGAGDVVDSEPDGDNLSVTGFTVAGDATVYSAGDVVTIAGVGSFTLGSNGAYTFTPVANWNGAVPAVTYTVSDGEGGTDTADLVITVNPVVDLAAADDSATTDEDTPVSGSVAGNDATTSGGSLTFAKASDPAHGTVVVNPDGTYTYTPASNYNGPDSFTYTVTDPASGETLTQTVNITVNPVVDLAAADDSATTDEDTPVSGSVAGNDATTSGGSLTFAKASDPAHGTVVVNADGTYTYTPASNYNGPDSFTYTVTDPASGETLTQTVNITVDPVNDAPVVSGGDQSGLVIEAGNLDDGTVIPGMANTSASFVATDADNDALTWSIVGTPDATYGDFSIDPATGAWTYALNNALPATQALNEGDTVDLTFTVQVSAGAGGTAVRNVTITITGTNDAPVASSDTGTVTEAGVVGGGNAATPGVATASGNVLTNDADTDAGEKATLQVSGVSFGASAGTVGSALTGAYGSLLLAADGTYVYTLSNSDPDAQALRQGDTVTETFTYTVIDVNGAVSTSTLTLTVTGTNDRPIITSDAAAATGSVTEAGTDAGTETTTGLLTASDVDSGAAQTWSIAATNGTYGTIAIDPATGQWTYTIDNSRAATQSLNGNDTGTETFTARVTDEFGAYSEQIITISVVGSNDDLTGTTANATVPLMEDGSANGTLQDYVSDVDDVIAVTGFQVDANGDGIPESFAPGSTVSLTDADGNARGTLTIDGNGSYSFTPAANYSGTVPTVTYTMAEASGGTGTVTQTITFDITPVADAPELQASKTVNTTEDTPGALGLIVPILADNGTAGSVNGDYPERLGEITLTISGAGANGVTLSTGGTVLTPVGGKITIVLTDMDHVAGMPAEDNANGVYYLTSAQYAALTVNPLSESGRDFTVTVSATSFEVDSTGVILPGVAGATSTQVINVDVLAVTDGAGLTIDGGTSASMTAAEDTVIDLTSHLSAVLNDADGNAGGDTDGSETYWYSISGLPIGTVVTIDGVSTTITGTVASAVSSVSATAAPPSITVRPPANYSGDIEGITITLNSRDTDGDSAGAISTISSSVNLDLYITPAAGDVSVGNVTSAEDTAVAFLAGLTVTDGGTGAGTEVIDSVSFTVPTGWTVVAPPASAGWDFDLTGSAATISFDSTLTESQREAILDAFMIEPPAHSSADATITLAITTTDTNTVNGASANDTATVNRDVKVTVTPVAERTDTDSDGVGGNDVTMIGDHAYSMPGQEDTWFALGSNYTGASNVGGGHDLMAGWSNADVDEFTYAVLTPTLVPDRPGDEVAGTQFRYSTDGGATWVTQTYAGEPIWVPQQYLDTLQVKLPPDVSGALTIGMQAGTVDYDDDADVSTLPLNPPHVSGAGVNVNVTGSATLSQIKFDPVADAVTMALNGRAAGLEDTSIPLAVRTTSSDPSETFNVTISGIPVGATITYGTGAGAITFTATVGNTSLEIPNFSNSAPLAITPPLHANENFSLTVSATSIDGASTSGPVSRMIDVSVTGVADAATVTLPAVSHSTTEATLDSGSRQVALSDLVTGVTSADTDGSETTTLRITGLAEDFSVTGATMVTSGVGGERVWVVAVDKLADVSIIVPPNYSGTVNFKVAGVTTENDGDSRTGALVDVAFTVTPSPEATTTTSATLVEDVVTALNLAIVQQNGDSDETLGRVYIAQDYAVGADYTLYLGGVALEAAGLSITTIGGVDYYIIPADLVAELGGRSASNLDGDLGSLDFLFEAVDPSSDGSLPAGTEIKSGTLALTATPVTDAVDASIMGIAMTSATGTTGDAIAGDDAAPDTATVTGSGAVTVNLHVNSVDSDGSEHLVRVLITGVPDGVTVTGASQVGAGTWLLIYEDADAQSIGTGGIDVPVEFIIGQGTGTGTSSIGMTVLAQDEGQSSTAPTGIETDTVSWNLAVELADGEPYAPPVIDEWRYNGAAGTEDTAFVLGSVINAAVSTSNTGVAYSYTVTITDLPAGSTVNGMVLTTIGGVPTWTATVTVPVGGDSQTALANLLSSITITPPANGNDNGASFGFDARLTASAVGGSRVETNETADMPIVPVSDEAVITVTTSDVGEGTDSLNATISVQDPADGAHGQIVDGKLYVQVSTTNNDGGTITDGAGAVIPLTAVSGVAGVPDGDYHVIDVGTAGGSVDLIYTAANGETLKPGDVTFTAYAQTQETGASNVAASTASGTAGIEIIHNGVVMASQAVTGNEAASADKSNAIELSGLSVALVDNDGSESIQSILLSGVPVGFLLYVGSSAGDATLAAQASNAGGDGVTNTWVLSADGTLPAYVAILPAPHWSGTLTNLALVVESGEGTLPTTRVDTIPLEAVVVNAVANGVTIDTTQSFGIEGQVIDLHLNAAMADAVAANAAVADGSIETTTLQFTGLGEHAAFYIGDNLLAAVSYDPVTDTYTITGLSQDDLDDLGFIQAAAALTDQDGATAGTQVSVTAWTVESGNGAQSAPVSDTLTLAVTPVLATTGNDRFTWGGEAIDGKAGVDTVALRYGEDLNHSDLATLLDGVEVIDLSVSGENRITGGLSISDVFAITGSNSGQLTINGDDDDAVELSSTDEWVTDGIVTDGHVTYTSTTSGVTLSIDEDINVSYAA